MKKRSWKYSYNSLYLADPSIWYFQRQHQIITLTSWVELEMPPWRDREGKRGEKERKATSLEEFSDWLGNWRQKTLPNQARPHFLLFSSIVARFSIVFLVSLIISNRAWCYGNKRIKSYIHRWWRVNALATGRLQLVLPVGSFQSSDAREVFVTLSALGIGVFLGH